MINHILLPHHACVCYLKSDTFSKPTFTFNKNSIDVLYKFLDSFGIDDIIEIKQFASRNPVVSSVTTLSVECNKMTLQAQNSLLKILEDPPAKTQFIFFVSSKSVFIPTVQSRLHDITDYFIKEYGAQSAACIDVPLDSIINFTSSAHKERLAFIDRLVKTEKIDDFINSFRAVYMQVIKNDSDKRALSFVMQNINQPGASKKMLLEYLALQISVVRK